MIESRNCAGLTRRNVLQLGLGSALGGGFVDLLRLRGIAGTTAPKPTSCILIWLDGGPSHFETFDPKPDAPKEIRGEFEPIATKTPGVQFSQSMQKLAAMSDRISVVRSIMHNDPNHGGGNHYMMTGSPTRIPVFCGAFVSFHPSLGSVTAHERGVQNGLPGYFTLPSMTRSGGPNFLGAKYAPFQVSDDPNGANFRVRDVALPVGLDGSRFEGRRDIRTRVDRMVRITDKAAGDPALALDEYYHQGLGLVTSPDAQKAFDIHRELPSIRDKYGRNNFGQQALLARRLVEAGVPFITINQGGWDHHAEL